MTLRPQRLRLYMALGTVAALCLLFYWMGGIPYGQGSKLQRTQSKKLFLNHIPRRSSGKSHRLKNVDFHLGQMGSIQELKRHRHSPDNRDSLALKSNGNVAKSAELDLKINLKEEAEIDKAKGVEKDKDNQGLSEQDKSDIINPEEDQIYQNIMGNQTLHEPERDNYDDYDVSEQMFPDKSKPKDRDDDKNILKETAHNNGYLKNNSQSMVNSNHIDQNRANQKIAEQGMDNPKAGEQDSGNHKAAEQDFGNTKAAYKERGNTKAAEQDKSNPKTVQQSRGFSNAGVTDIDRAVEQDKGSPKTTEVDKDNAKHVELGKVNPKANEQQSSNPKANEQQSSNTKANEQQNFNSKANEQQSSNAKANEQQSFNLKANEQQSSNVKAYEQQSLNPKANEQQSFNPKADEQQSFNPKANEQQSSNPKANEQKSFNPKANEQQSSNAKANEQQSLNPKATEQQSSNAKANEQQSSNAKANEQQSLNPKANEQQSLNPTANEQQSFNPKANEQQSSNAKANEQQSFNPKANEQQSFNPKANEQQSFNPKANEQQSFNPKANEQQSISPKANEQEGRNTKTGELGRGNNVVTDQNKANPKIGEPGIGNPKAGEQNRGNHNIEQERNISKPVEQGRGIPKVGEKENGIRKAGNQDWKNHSAGDLDQGRANQALQNGTSQATMLQGKQLYSIKHGNQTSAMNEQLQDKLKLMLEDIATDEILLSSESFPASGRLAPSVGNGYLGTLIHAPEMFMSGLYNGKQEQSHRASIPSTVSFNITGTEPPVKLKRSYNLDLAKGVYYEESSRDMFNITQKTYAHRTLKHIIVVEIDLIRKDATTPMKLLVNFFNKQNSSQDITFRDQSSGMKEVGYKVGSIAMPEKDGVPYSEVHLLYDHVPDHLDAPVNTERTKWVFLTAVATGRTDAFKAYDYAKQLVHHGNELYFQHVMGWAELWKDGLIKIEGNKDLAKKTYASWYYLLSSMPLTDDSLRKFNGLSPCGLPVGGLHKDYQGHVTSDQELWLFPPFLFYHPQLARLLLLSRFNTKRGAMLNAKSSLLPGLQYAYESANTGEEVGKTKGKEALYTSAAVAMAATKYLRLTNDTALLSQVNFNEILVGIAQFIHSRVSKHPDSMKYEFRDVVSLDNKFKVNNSAFVTAIARVALDALQEAYARIGIAYNEFNSFARNIHIPYDKGMKYHPAYEGYSLGKIVKKADTVMLGYPVGGTPDFNDISNDISYYLRVTDDRAPPTTWAMLTIALLSVNDRKNAEKTFSHQTDFVKNSFMVWTESRSSAENNVTNYISGAATFLQSLHNGYGGFRVLKDRLNMDPVLPPEVTGINFVGVKYLGSSLDVYLNSDNRVSVVMRIQGPTRLHMVDYKSKAIYELEENKKISLPAGKLGVFQSKLKEAIKESLIST